MWPPIALIVALVAFAVPFTSALQNIYIGTINVCPYGPDWYVWFIDSPPCTSGTDLSPASSMGTGICAGPVTILGHPNITFSGCPSIDGIPTGVSDGGNPALTCNPVSFPDQQCPNPCGDMYPDVLLTTGYQCS